MSAVYWPSLCISSWSDLRFFLMTGCIASTWLRNGAGDTDLAGMLVSCRQRVCASLPRSKWWAGLVSAKLRDEGEKGAARRVT
jgi:hypothetical protein